MTPHSAAGNTQWHLRYKTEWMRWPENARLSASLQHMPHEVPQGNLLISAKHGALSQNEGKIEVSWSLGIGKRQTSTFDISWVGKEGSPVTPPNRKGFGSTVLGTMAKLGLGAEVEFTFDPAGLTWRLTCPADKVIETGAAIAPLARSRQANGSASRVLVVDDEPLICLEIVDVLSSAGWSVVGPAASVSEALMLVSSESCDAAVLDINLGRETSELIVRKLKQDHIPFVTVPGFAVEQQPAVFRGSPFLSKPLRSERLISAVKQCLSQATPVRVN